LQPTQTAHNCQENGKIKTAAGGIGKIMFERITFDPQIMGGRACIRGMRVTVALVLSLLANQMSFAEILAAYPYLENEDILAALQYAVFLAGEEIRPLNEIAA
jgi:uncharacterized protein (DUF433 family)